MRGNGKRVVLRYWKMGTAVASGAAILTLSAGFSMNSNPRGTRAMGHPAIAGKTATPQSEEAQGGTLGGSVISSEGAAEVDIASLPQLTAQQAAAMPRYSHRPLNGLTEAQYNALKAEAAKRGIANQGPAPTAAPSSGRSGGIQPVNITAGFFSQQEVCCAPPDMALAVGPTFVVQFVNTFIAVYDKNGSLQPGFPKSANTFFGLPAGTYTTDPRGFYDWVNNRYVFTMLMESSPDKGTNTGSLLIAATATANPNGAWFVYSPAFTIGSSGECPDFDTLGHDYNNWGRNATKGGIYVGINQFGGSGNCGGSSFTGNHLFLIPKDAIYGGKAFGAWDETGLNVGGTLVDTLQPANMTDSLDHPSAIFLVNSFNLNWGGGMCVTGCNGLEVWTVTGPAAQPNNPFEFLVSGGGGPTISSTRVETSHNYSLPPNADEMNGSGGVCAKCIDTDDTRITGQVKYNAGSLWGSFNSSTGTPEAGLIWFEVHPVMNNTSGVITSAEKRQEECYVCGGWASNGSAYYGTLQPDPEGNVLMVFEFSSDKNFASTAFTSRRVTLGDSLMDGLGIYLERGAAFYNQGRWGDYTATAPDLSNSHQAIMWIAGMYANAAGNWGTVMGQGRYLLPTDQ